MTWRQLAPRFALSALLALAVLPVPARAAEPASAGRKLSAEERLDAIRHGLVQAALEGATRVESVAWVDTQGRLHESSSFKSGMQVRGVQVLGYVRDAEGQPRARLQLPAAEPRAGGLATGVRTATASRRDLYKDGSVVKAAPACPSNHGLRHVIGLELVVGGRWPAQDAAMAHALAEMISAALLHAEPPAAAGANAATAHANWRMWADGDSAFKTADEAPRSAYEKAMLGTDSPPLPWQASIQVLPGPPFVPPHKLAFLQPLLGKPTTVPTARISLSLSPKRPGRGASGEVLRLTADVALLREPSQWQAPQFSPEGSAQVQALLARWSQAVSEQLACETVRPELLPTANGTLRLNAGALAGVQPGEEWLLADPAAFPERLLAPGVAQQLVLAKVHRVHARHAELQLLAGPGRPVQPGWRAWRAESPLGD